MEDRAQRPAGILATLAATFARFRAGDPEPPQQWTPPRGLGELGPLLDQVRSASGASLPAIQRDSGGTSFLTARAWCDRAGLAPHVGTVAVLLASEAEAIDKFPQYAWAIAEAVVNAASHFQRGEYLADAIVRRVVGDSRPALDGRFSAQGGRWASTAQQPNGRHLKCAELVVGRMLTGHLQILAHDAIQWTDEDTQHLVHVAALKAGDDAKAARNPPPEVVMARRYASGTKWVGPVVDAVGEVVIDPWKLTLLGQTGVDEPVAAAMLADGRCRWRRPA